MATYTEHYNLIKPALNDKVNINNLNDNADILDTALYNKVDTTDTQNIITSANKCMMSDGVTSAEDELGSKSTVMVKDVTFTLIPGSPGSTRSASTGVPVNKILSVYLIYSDDVYHLIQTDKFTGIVYSVDELGSVVIVASPDKRWGEVTVQRTLNFRVAYLV